MQLARVSLLSQPLSMLFLNNPPSSLRSLTLANCITLLPSPHDTANLLSYLSSSCLKLSHLDLPGLAWNDSCLPSLLPLRQLTSLDISMCKISTISLVQVLTGLPNLRRAECTFGRQSKLLSAVSAVPSSSRLKLTRLTF